MVNNFLGIHAAAPLVMTPGLLLTPRLLTADELAAAAAGLPASPAAVSDLAPHFKVSISHGVEEQASGSSSKQEAVLRTSRRASRSR